MNNSKVRVLYVVRSLCVGGIENSVVSLCNNLSREKYTVGILVLTNNHLELLNKIKKDVNIHIIPLKQYNNMIVNILFLLFNFPHIVKVLQLYSPGIIHTHIYQYNIFPIFLGMLFFKRKIYHFHTIHTTGLHYANNSIGSFIKLKIEDICYRIMSTNLICVSKEIERNVRSFFNHIKYNIRIIENGVDLKRFTPSLYDKNRQKFILVYVSRLVDGKNHITLLKSFANLSLKYKNIELWFIGDGDLKNQLIQYTQKCKIKDKVCFFGNIDNIPEILSQCNLAVFPSEYEGFSVALIEMMAMGLPVICSDIQNFKDLFGDSGALFFSVHNDLQLSTQIEKLYLDNKLLEFYANCSKQISQKYSIIEIVNKIDLYYQSVYK